MTVMLAADVLHRYGGAAHTIVELVDRRAAVVPQAAAVEFEQRAWTYAQLVAGRDALAARLAVAGVLPGDRVAHVEVNSDIAVLLFLATTALGAIFVPMNPALTDDDLAYQLGHCGARLMVSAAGEAARFDALLATYRLDIARLALEDLGSSAPDSAAALAQLQAGAGSAAPSAATLTAETPAVVIYTSGTTGRPKGVLHSHANYVLSAEAFVGRLDLQPDERLLTVFPLFHINALFYSLGGALACGGAFITARRFSASTFWALAVKTRATELNILASLAKILAVRPRSEFDPRHQIRLIYGGPITADMFEVYRNDFHVPVLLEGYGMSEIPAAACNPLHGEQKVGSFGLAGTHPLVDGPFVRMRVCDDTGAELPADSIGELQVRTPAMFLGYLNDPQQTRESFVDGWFRTGDLVRRDAQGYLTFVARQKDIIRRHGENISGAELDRVVESHPLVAQAAAIAVPSELGEDEVLIAIVKAPQADALTLDDIAAWCRERLAAVKRPRYLVFVDALPQTPTQRVAKHVLRKDATLLARARDMR
ncbi:MAG: Acyl-CoA synthetase (AMP-forming)/AMP-acid ligase [Pseudomonadota bacterium]|jgi:crotonobetaine/carnitine-CoA ligase